MDKSTSDIVAELINELNRNLKELRDMAEVLGKDCSEQYSSIENCDSQTHRRAYVRSIFALIEGIIHRMKFTAVHLGGSMGTLSIGEIVLINEVSFDVNDKGEVISRSVFVKFLSNIKFAFKVYSKSFGSTFELSLGGDGWQMLRNSVKVRDRLMHPKTIADLEVTNTEVEAIKKAYDWFVISYYLCSNYAQKSSQAKTSLKPEDIAALDARILELEAQLQKTGLG